MIDLSPAAQAVLIAADSTFEQAGTTRQGIAAAIEALADQVVPANGSRKNNEIRTEILSIATGLKQ